MLANSGKRPFCEGGKKEEKSSATSRVRAWSCFAGRLCRHEPLVTVDQTHHCLRATEALVILTSPASLHRLYLEVPVCVCVCVCVCAQACQSAFVGIELT